MLSVWESNKLLCVIIFSNFSDEDIEVSIVSLSRKWQNSKTLYEVFCYPFNQLGCTRITGRVKADNKKCISLSDRTGWVKEGVMRKASKGIDVIIYGMLKEEAFNVVKKLKEVEDGKKNTTATACS